MEDNCRENGNQKQKGKSKVSPKLTPRRGRKRKQRFTSPKRSPAISIQDSGGLVSDESTAESEGIQSPIHTPKRARRTTNLESPRGTPQLGKQRNSLRQNGDKQPIPNSENDRSSVAVSVDQPVGTHANSIPATTETRNGDGIGRNGDTTSHGPIELATNNKPPIAEQEQSHHFPGKESEVHKALAEEPDVHHEDQSSNVERPWVAGQEFLPRQVTRSADEVLMLAEQGAAEVMARMNCLEKDEDILDVEEKDASKGNTQIESFPSQDSRKIAGKGKQNYVAAYHCNDAEEPRNLYATSADNRQSLTMYEQPTENVAVSGQRVESLNNPPNCDHLPTNGNLQKTGEATDENSGQKGTILSSLLEGRDQESLLAAELLTRLDRDIHLSEIQPTICLDQNNYPNYANMGYGNPSPSQNIGVSKYLEHHQKKLGSSGVETTNKDNGINLSLDPPPPGDQDSCTFQSQQSGLKAVGENGAERLSPPSDSLSTPATRQTASQILYQNNRTGQEQLGPDCQRRHSFHGMVEASSIEQGRINVPPPRHSDPGAPGWEQSQINAPPQQHSNLGVQVWDQGQQSYHQLVSQANQKDPLSLSSAFKAPEDQLNNRYRYGQMIPENSPYHPHQNLGPQKQADNPGLYDRRDQNDAIIPVEQGVSFGHIVEDPHYNGLPSFQSGNYLNLPQEAIDNMIQSQQASSFVGSPSIQGPPLATNVSTPDTSVQGFGDFVNYSRSSQSSEDQVQYFRPIRSKSQGHDEMVTHMVKRRRRSTPAKTVDNDRNPAYVDVVNNSTFRKPPMPFEHGLHQLQAKDSDTDRFFLILSPEVNPDEVRDIGHKGLIAKYIDYLIVENEQITEMSKAVSIPIEHCVMDDPYLMDIIRVKIPFPTLKYYQWLRSYYPSIQIDWLALNHQMLQFQPVGDCRPHHYILDKRPAPVLLGESFYFFQRERDRLLPC
ncbi:uncharacterized protein LOC110440461 [Mizuhopecten yessoensis]|nr:uncharacterized protein LOC110440461 [Mizuhopecten yessoensis]XP_021339239.1 uncharacterized protein LOC110440461 [Mizuhopecten yessoensis]